MSKWYLYRLVGTCPARSVDDLIDYYFGNPDSFLDRFTVEEVPDNELEQDDRDYLKGLEEFDAD